MRQTLQNKVNLLGSLMVVFVLLMLPMFSQVKADTRDSVKDAKNTLLVKWLRELTKGQKAPSNINEAEVEDYWREIQRQNPNCGTECDPDADFDGDGVSNGDEMKDGKNPFCNEKEMGEDYCRNVSKSEPPANRTVDNRTGVVDELFNVTKSIGDCPGGTFPVQDASCTLISRSVNRKYDFVNVYLNTTQYHGVEYRLTFRNETASDIHSWFGPNTLTSPNGVTIQEPEWRSDGAIWPGVYRFDLSVNADRGTWEIKGYGIVR